ncbi:MAG TPA: flagellar motor protein MotA, partial [Gammaproteobacteria bacterium]|nr:flagellar motor protein MotA [Gammaproteobacteria bacterium]
MGTLIPLGPGLAALGRGELASLAEAVILAFDTTVLGLLVGLVGFVLGRLRRRWYDSLLDALEAAS